MTESFGHFFHFCVPDGPSDRFMGWNSQKSLHSVALEGTTGGGDSEVSKRILCAGRNERSETEATAHQ